MTIYQIINKDFNDYRTILKYETWNERKPNTRQGQSTTTVIFPFIRSKYKDTSPLVNKSFYFELLLYPYVCQTLIITGSGQVAPKTSRPLFRSTLPIFQVNSPRRQVAHFSGQLAPISGLTAITLNLFEIRLPKKFSVCLQKILWEV
jgi:hypothetical protein